jgi:hypothetical protein
LHVLMTALRRESKGDGQGQPEDRDELLEERRRQDAGVRGKRQKETRDKFRERRRRGINERRRRKIRGPFSSAQLAFEFSLSQTQLLAPDQPPTSNPPLEQMSHS